jgi:hypothetical protein
MRESREKTHGHAGRKATVSDQRMSQRHRRICCGGPSKRMVYTVQPPRFDDIPVFCAV